MEACATRWLMPRTDSSAGQSTPAKPRATPTVVPAQHRADELATDESDGAHADVAPEEGARASASDSLRPTPGVLTQSACTES